MADAGDGLSLLGRGRGQQCAGGTEQDTVPLSLPHPVEKVTGEHGGRASAPRPTTVYVLVFQVKYHSAAVVVVGKLDAVPGKKIPDNVFAQFSKIPGDDQIIEGGLPPCIPDVGGKGVIGCRGHGGSHVVGVFDTLVHHLSCGDVGHIGTGAGLCQDHRT